MDVSAVSIDPSAYSTKPDPEVERTTLVLKKQQDVAKDQAQGMIALIQAAGSVAQAGPAADGTGQLISVYA
jgi:hypothetical protein